jgi:cobalt-zinc-cadmium efflux system protein
MVHSHKPLPEHKHHDRELHQVGEYRSVERGKLKLAMIITGVVMVIEVIGGIFTNSLALLSDAGHMFTHFVALGIALIAIVIADREACHHRTFGLYRVEILAALFNSLFLFGVTLFILKEGVQRLLAPEAVMGLQTFYVALVGLSVNLISAWILYGTSRRDLNVRGAFLHMLADTVSSMVIIVGAIVIYYTEWYIVDALMSVGISVVIFVWAWGLFKDSINVLLEAAPRGMDTEEIGSRLMESIGEIEGIEDIHVWEITSNMYSLTAHIRVNGDMSREKNRELLGRINRLLDEEYDIHHTTLQLIL